MTRDDVFIEQLEGYLDEYEGQTPLPDAVRAAVRATLPTTKQAGAVSGPLKLMTLGTSIPAPALYGLVAAALVAAVILGNFVLTGGNVGDEDPPMSPTPPESTLIAPGQGGPLAAGAYYVDSPFPLQLSFDVPQDTDVFFYEPAGSQVNLNVGTGGEVSFEIVDNLAADPCTKELLDPPVGSAVEDLATALANLPGFAATAATDVTVDGFQGKQLTLTAPHNPAPCRSMLTWKTTTRQNGVGPGEVNEVTILDVDGTRLLICIAYQPSTSPADLSDAHAIVDSVQIDH
jgi:hypothetical protein